MLNKQFSFSVKTLKWLSISYLALPIILFFIFWLKPIYGVIFISLFAFSFWKYFQNESKSLKIDIQFGQIIGLIFIVGIWVFISGAGGWGFQSPDLSKHSSIYKDVLENSFPISYLYQGKTIYLSAYLAYYIPIPIMLGGFSWEIMMFFVAIWTLIGALIGIIWFCILVNSFSPKWIIFFILIGGIDFAGFIFSNGLSEAFNQLFHKFYEIQPFWASQTDPKMLLVFRGNTHSLFWGPQHALPCWIATGLFFYEWFYEKSIKNSPIYLILLPFWSPFILLGLAPFILFEILKNGAKKYLTFQNLILIPVFLVLVWFVNSVPVNNLEKGLIFYKPGRLLDYLSEIKTYLFFIFMEVGIWAILVYFIFKKAQNQKYINLLLCVFLILMLVPLYKLGKWNDFVQRVSMPALYILWILVVLAWQKTKSIYMNVIFSVLFIISSWDSLYHILFSLKVTHYQIKYTAIPKENITNFVETSEKEKWPIEQSFAPDSALFFKYMTKQNKE